ncbi:MMPL family transporter [Chitinivorax sp. B]|uniref:MMPL family transporter n=1 Tax=Chitinivorax sp. B TaxID=2502235 RepID=UPI0010F50B82|nr:MMPL family transporter [Chitinivorax sp. B]
MAGHNSWVWLAEKRLPETDMLALLPTEEHDPAVRTATQQFADAAQQRLIVLVGDRDWQAAKRAATAYRNVALHHPQWLKLSPAPAMDEQALSRWWQQRGQLLTTADQQRLQYLPPAVLAQQALRDLASPLGQARFGAWQDDPFGLFNHWLADRAALTPVRQVDGELRVDDGNTHYALISFDLTQSAFSIGAQHTIMPILADAATAARTQAPNAHLLSAGVLLHTAAASTQASDEMSTIGLGSLFGIMLLMWFAFRSLRPISLVLLTLGAGMLGALSVCALLFDRIHLITLVFGASLIGVAEDYGIHYLATRIGDQQPPLQTMQRLIPGLALAMVTTVVGYIGLGLTPFPGLQQMAVFSAVGLTTAWITAVLWTPWLTSPYQPETRFSQWYGRTRAHWPRLQRTPVGIGIAVGCALVIGFGITRLTTNDDIRQLQNSPPVLVADQQQISRILKVPAPAQFFLIRADTEAGLLMREETLRNKLEELVQSGTLEGYQAVSQWVPSPERQRTNQMLISTHIWREGGAAPQLARILEEAPDWVHARQHQQQANGLLTVNDWLQSPISQANRHLWLGHVNGQLASVVTLLGVEKPDLPLLRNLASSSEGVTWVDKVDEISSLMARYRGLMGWVVMASYLAVLLVLWPRYRTRAFRILLPTLIASLVVLAWLGWSGTPLQLFHVLALLMILCMGEDYGIFMQEHPDPQDRHAWLAVSLSAASTLLSFGLLGLSATPALKAFGMTLLIGISTVWLIAPCFDRNKSIL